LNIQQVLKRHESVQPIEIAAGIKHSLLLYLARDLTISQ
jgi:hypothetical protein